MTSLLIQVSHIDRHFLVSRTCETVCGFKLVGSLTSVKRSLPTGGSVRVAAVVKRDNKSLSMEIQKPKQKVIFIDVKHLPRSKYADLEVTRTQGDVGFQMSYKAEGKRAGPVEVKIFRGDQVVRALKDSHSKICIEFPSDGKPKALGYGKGRCSSGRGDPLSADMNYETDYGLLELMNHQNVVFKCIFPGDPSRSVRIRLPLLSLDLEEGNLNLINVLKGAMGVTMSCVGESGRETAFWHGINLCSGQKIPELAAAK